MASSLSNASIQTDPPRHDTEAQRTATAQVPKRALEHALDYAARGWRVHLLRPRLKTPLTLWGQEATSDETRIRSWFETWPDANLAICGGGPAGLLIVDVDVKKGAQGEASLAALIAQHGPLPPTRTARTPSGGRHLYFRTDAKGIGNRVGLRHGLDVRAEGGYVVAPPSYVDDGKVKGDYRWEDEGDIAEAPAWLIDVIRDPPPPSGAGGGVVPLRPSLAGFPEGVRNTRIFRLASRYRSQGLAYEEARHLVLEAAGNCTPPMADTEAIQCLNSAYKRYTPEAPVRPLTEVGLAERLIDRHGENLRYVGDTDDWLRWDDVRWTACPREQVHRLMVEVIRDVPDAFQDDDMREKAKKFAKASETRARIDNAIQLAARDERVTVVSTQLDADPMLLGVRNGVVDLKTGELLAPDRARLVTKQCGVAFDAEAKCPRWRRFVSEIMGGDSELLDFLQRCAGYALTAHTRDQHLFVAYGTGANGKSTFLNTLGEVLGDYARTVPPEVFMVNRHQGSAGPREDVLRLKDARLALTTEVGDGQVLNEDLVKRMTGGDSLVGRLPYARRSVEFSPRFKPWMATNYKPIIRGDDEGIWRRMLLIPFEQRFVGSNCDPKLEETLRGELPGILNWAMEGCAIWWNEGLTIPDQVREASTVYREEMDLLAEWIEAKCDRVADEWTATDALYRSYTYWREDSGSAVMSRSAFGRRLGARGLRAEKQGGQRGFVGIGLKKPGSEAVAPRAA